MAVFWAPSTSPVKCFQGPEKEIIRVLVRGMLGSWYRRRVELYLLSLETAPGNVLRVYESLLRIVLYISCFLESKNEVGWHLKFVVQKDGQFTSRITQLPPETVLKVLESLVESVYCISCSQTSRKGIIRVLMSGKLDSWCIGKIKLSSGSFNYPR